MKNQKNGIYHQLLNALSVSLRLVSFLLILSWILMTVPILRQPAQIELETKADANKLKALVLHLSESSPPRSYKHPESLDATANYIFEHFDKYCDQVWFQEYEAEDVTFTQPLPVKNVICSFNQTASSRFIFGAHYDVSGEFPGADDNASGVAGILELARLLHENQIELDTRIDLVAYTLEEPPFFRSEYMGSYIHAQSVVEDTSVETLGMLTVEMIGYFSDEPGSQRLLSPIMRLFYPDTGNFIGIIGNATNQNFVGRIKSGMRRGTQTLPVYSLNAPRTIPGVDFADHLNYWDRGLDAAMVIDTGFYRNPNYHTAGDTPETLDYKRMAQVVDGLVSLAESL